MYTGVTLLHLPELLSLERLARLTGGQLIGKDNEVTGFATDSNAVHHGDVFLAIKGARVDGHEFVANALARGAAGTLAERPVEGPHVLVPNLVEALATMAARFRASFAGPVVGVTGSAGKTVTKEFIAEALRPLGHVLKSEGNRNTEYTSPLIWTELRQDHHAVVVEMSMRGFGQIEHLASFSRPTIGVITNIGYAHIEMVGNREGIARAKGELIDSLPPEGVVVLWQEDEYLEVLKERAGGRRVVTFGQTDLADSKIISYRPIDWATCEVFGEVFGVGWSAVLPAVGRHMALNAAAAMATAHVAGVSPGDAAESMSQASLPPMRMEVVPLNGVTVLLDTYNASPPSMIAAIETLAEMPVEGKRRAVIGEMRELGEHSEEAHRMVGRAIAIHGLDEVLFVGDAMLWALDEANGPGDDPSRLHVSNDLHAVRKFLSASKPGDVVLIKGSRALELERSLEGLK